MPVLVTPNDVGIYAFPLYLSGYTCTFNLNLGTGFILAYNFTSVGGYTFYPEVTTDN